MVTVASIGMGKVRDAFITLSNIHDKAFWRK